jgi:uncharacterized protein (TIGR02145 family)
MKFSLRFSAVILCVLFFSFAEGEKKEQFKTITVNGRTWMAENLDVQTFRNGDTIFHAQTRLEWEKAGNDSIPAWCYYENDTANGKKYGKLYNWFAVLDPRGVAPVGWKVASHTEWEELMDAAGGKKLAGGILKSKDGWERSGNGNDSLGFCALPGGTRSPEGFFSQAGRFGFYWTRTWAEISSAFVTFSYTSPLTMIGQQNMKSGMAIRCLKSDK